MRKIFYWLFGAKSERLYVANIDGIDWYPAAQICELLEIGNVSAAMKGGGESWMLSDNEKRKVKDNNYNSHNVVWFITEGGFWKLLWASRGYKAQHFRETMSLHIPGMLHNMLNETDIGEMNEVGLL